MEQFIVGIIVGAASLYILNRFRNYARAAKMGGTGCCGTCGCRMTKNEDEDTKIVAIPLKRDKQ